MNQEHESKFLVDMDTYSKWHLSEVTSHDIEIEQFYISITKQNSVRVRISDGRDAILNIKGNDLLRSRSEFETAINLDEAFELRSMSPFDTIYKRRLVHHDFEIKIEVDLFSKANAGLVIAEVEFESLEQMDSFEPYDWMKEEVTGERKYYNVSLAVHPFMYWEENV